MNGENDIDGAPGLTNPVTGMTRIEEETVRLLLDRAVENDCSLGSDAEAEVVGVRVRKMVLAAFRPPTSSPASSSAHQQAS